MTRDIHDTAEQVRRKPGLKFFLLSTDRNNIGSSFQIVGAASTVLLNGMINNCSL